jgi:hypothetical protein
MLHDNPIDTALSTTANEHDKFLEQWHVDSWMQGGPGL